MRGAGEDVTTTCTSDVRVAARENLIKRARTISADPLIKRSPRGKFWHRAFTFKHLHRSRQYSPIDAPARSARGRAGGGKAGRYLSF